MIRLTDIIALQVVVLDAATTRIAAGTASECQTFQLDMPRQVRSMMSSLSMRMSQYQYHAGLSLISSREKTAKYSQAALRLQIPVERWDIEDAALNRLEGRMPSRFAALMSGEHSQAHAKVAERG